VYYRPPEHGRLERGSGHRSARATGPAAHLRTGRERVPLPARRPQPEPRARRAPLRPEGARRMERALRPRRLDHRHLRRELELARPGVVPDQLFPHRGARAVPPLLRRRAEGRVPHRLGALPDAVGVGTSSPGGFSLFLPTRTGAGRPTATRRGTPPTRRSATWCCSTSSFTATPEGPRGRATRRAGPGW
jgi:hypothetical protein